MWPGPMKMLQSSQWVVAPSSLIVWVYCFCMQGSLIGSVSGAVPENSWPKLGRERLVWRRLLALGELHRELIGSGDGEFKGDPVSRRQ